MKKKWVWSIVAVFVLVGGAWTADHMLKGRSHPGLATFLRQWWVNYPASFTVEPSELSLHVEQADLDVLESVVEAARERGVIMPEGNDYVPAELAFEGATFKAKVRIKGKMSDHVKGSKWSFRVIAKKDKGFLGMQRFSLQHPGTRNYLCDWFYHRLMRGEGIIALRYGFIRLKFNDEDLGIYAYEEHFGPELLANNGRLKGPIFRFDPSLFWVHRLNMMQQVRYNEPFGAYEAAALDAFGGGDLEKDSVQRRYMEEAVGRMDAFRRGDLRASEVFDADKLGRRHAMLDLVGGHHSMDWSDVKFYYDPVVKRIEPIAYESFSAFPIRTLAGSNRYNGKGWKGMDLHDAYFNDPVLFRSYVHHLERMSDKAYLDSAFTALAPALDSASALIYREFPYKELDRSIYYKNQSLIRRLLDVPKGFHAYFDGGTDTLQFTVIPIEGLPIEIHGLVGKEGALIVPDEPTIVPCRVPGTVGIPMSLRIPVIDGKAPSPGSALTLRYSVLGASVRKDLEALPYGYSDGLQVPTLPFTGNNMDAFTSVLQVDEEARTVIILPGVHKFQRDLVIPSGFVVKGVAPLRIDLVNGARILSRSPVSFVGMEDAPISIGSSDGSGGGLVLLETGTRSTFERVRFEGFGAAASGRAGLILQEAPASFVDCAFAEVRDRDGLLAVRSGLWLTNCSFTGGRDQLSVAFGSAEIEQVGLNGAGDDALVLKGARAKIVGLVVHGANGNGVKVDEQGVVVMNTSEVKSRKEAVAVSEGSTISMKGGALASTGDAALDVDALHARHGASQVDLQGVLVTPATGLKIGAGNRVLIDGKEQEAVTAPVKP